MCLNALADQKGASGIRDSATYFIFYAIYAQILQNNRFSRPSLGLAPRPFVWEILDLPLKCYECRCLGDFNYEFLYGVVKSITTSKKYK